MAVRPMRLLSVLWLGFAVVAVDPSLQACGSCKPTKQQEALDTTYYFDSTLINNDTVKDYVHTAVGSWNGYFELFQEDPPRGIYYDQGLHVGRVVVGIDDSICPAWGQAVQSSHYVKICSNSLTQSQPFLRRLFAHEFGHLFGYASGNCPKEDSVMTELQPSQMTAQTTLEAGCADGAAVERDYGTPPGGGGCKSTGESCEHDGECCTGICNDFSLQCDTAESPILIDVAGNGFSLTDPPNGVLFDLRTSGEPQLLSWTRADSDDAWLALDRNGNGTIDTGAELFGNFTPQPLTAIPNGFSALAVSDTNKDEWIDSADDVYTHLLLWTDVNHDGISQRNELRGLSEAGLLRLSLDVKTSGRRDRIGNAWRYRAKIVSVEPRDFGPYAYDVFVVVQSATLNRSVVPSGLIYRRENLPQR